MKKLILVLSILSIVSCKKEELKKEPLYPTMTEEVVQSPEELGAAIFEGKGTCINCHKIDVKLIGPSLQDIAKIYKEKNGNMISFLKGDGEAIVDPAQYEIMKVNFAITKTFSDEELKALEAYIYSNLK